MKSKEDKSLKELMNLNRLVVMEILDSEDPLGSWKVKALRKQLQEVTDRILALQKEGYEPTRWERIKSALKRFKISQLLTIFTNQ